MNFKPTLWKIIVSILSIIIVDLLLAISVRCVGQGAVCNAVWYNYILEPANIVAGLIVGIVVYLIWSLLQEM